jgi:hypothetical protein
MMNIAMVAMVDTDMNSAAMTMRKTVLLLLLLIVAGRRVSLLREDAS